MKYETTGIVQNYGASEGKGSPHWAFVVDFTEAADRAVMLFISLK